MELRWEILREILEVIIYWDVVERWRVDNFKVFCFFFKFLVFLSYVMIIKFYFIMKSLGIVVGKFIFVNYFEYLNDVFVVFLFRVYVKLEKKREFFGFKLYFVDNGLFVVLGVRDWSRLLENFVFMEFLKCGFELNRDLFYYVI